MGKTIVGVDIGSASLRAVEVENAGKPDATVVRYHEVSLPEGAARNGEVLESHTVASALKRLWATGGFKSRKVVLGMGSHRVLARDFSMPRMSMNELRDSLAFHVQDILPMPVEDALLDFYPLHEGEGENGPVVSGLLVAALKSAVIANVNAVRLAGLSPVEVDLIPFALTRAHMRGLPGSRTAAIVEVGASTTNVVIVNEGIPQFVRIIPVGGNDVTRAIQAEAELDAEQAEEAKFAIGLTARNATPEQRPIVDAIYGVMSELVNSIRNTISYFDNTRDHDTVELIVLSGGGSRLDGFSAALGDLTRIPVIANDTFASITLGKGITSVDEDTRESMTVALGLALGSAA